MQSPLPQRRIGTLGFHWMIIAKKSWHFGNLTQNTWILEQSMTSQLRNRISSCTLMRRPVDAACTWAKRRSRRVTSFRKWVRVGRVPRGESYQQSTTHWSQSFLPVIKGSYFKWFSDSQSDSRTAELFKTEVWKRQLKSFSVAPKTKLAWIFNGFHGRTLKGRTTWVE